MPAAERRPRLVRIVGETDHRRGERQTERVANRPVAAADEIQQREHLALHLGAVERGSRAERLGRHGARLFSGARVALAGGGRLPQLPRVHSVRLELRRRHERRVRVDLEPRRLVPGQVRLDQRGSDPGERIQHGAGAVRESSYRVLDEEFRIPGYPAGPPVDRLVAVGRERRAAEPPPPDCRLGARSNWLMRASAPSRRSARPALRSRPARHGAVFKSVRILSIIGGLPVFAGSLQCPPILR